MLLFNPYSDYMCMNVFLSQALTTCCSRYSGRKVASLNESCHVSLIDNIIKMPTDDGFNIAVVQKDQHVFIITVIGYGDAE